MTSKTKKASSWWWTSFVSTGCFLWPVVSIANDYEPPYVSGVVRHDPPDSLVFCLAFLNFRIKVGRKKVKP
jgi:hypothetical protein